MEARAAAQKESDFEIWGALFFTGQVFDNTPTPSFWFDAHARRSERGTVHILRPGVGFAFASWGSVWLGYAWTPEWLDATGERRDEHRIWEQLTLDCRRVVGLLIQSRTRFEQNRASLPSVRPAQLPARPAGPSRHRVLRRGLFRHQLSEVGETGLRPEPSLLGARRLRLRRPLPHRGWLPQRLLVAPAQSARARLVPELLRIVRWPMKVWDELITTYSSIEDTPPSSLA